jgi:hypothetical protein
MAAGDTNLTNLVLSGDCTIGDDLAVAGDAAVTGDCSIGDDLAVTGDAVISGGLAVTGTLAITGATTLTTKLGGAQLNTAVSRQRTVIQIAGGSTIADGTVYKQLFSLGRALTITRIVIAARVKPVGGTNTLAITKNGTTTVLGAATFDPTTITANDTAQALTLTATGADLALDADDTLFIEWTAGTQATDAQAVIVVIEYLVTDL